MVTAPSFLLVLRRWWPALAAAAAWLVWVLWLPPRPSPWRVLAGGLLPLAIVSARAARACGERWRLHVTRCWDWYLLGLALLYALGVQIADSHGVTTDGVIHFSLLRSAVFDRDLDVAAEFAYLGQPSRPSHVVPLGPALLWLPLYLVVAVIDAALRGLGLTSLPSGGAAALGLTAPYVRAASITSFAAGAAGLAMVHWLLRRECRSGVAFATSLLLFAATPLVWYMVYEPTMTHAASFGAVAALVLGSVCWLGHDGYSVRHALWLGALTGTAMLVRPQEALFALVPAALVFTVQPTWAGRAAAWWKLLRWAVPGVAAAVLLQVAHAAVLLRSTSFRLLGQDGQQGYLHPWDSRWVDTLYSSWHGLFSWSPVVYVAALGTVALVARRRAWALTALGLLVAMAWVNGMTTDWPGGWSFGGRRFISTLVVLAPGLALVIESALRYPQALLGVVVAAALAWNYGLMVQYTAGMLPKDEPVSFGRMVRQQSELLTRPPYVYPFAFPANAWFAWREGLPVDRYDLLSTEPITGDVTVTLDNRGERFLLGGWEAPGGDEWGAHWWLNRSPATLVVPVDIAAGRVAEIEVTARTRFEEPPVEARLEVRVNGRPAGQFAAPPTTAGTARLTVPYTTGLWRRGFNRVEIVSLGVERLDRADTRPPGSIARNLNGRPWPVAIYRLRVRSL